MDDFQTPKDTSYSVEYPTLARTTCRNTSISSRTVNSQFVSLVKQNKEISSVMDAGESVAAILYQGLETNQLLIDDKKARSIAEKLGVRCIGTIGMLIKAKRENYNNLIVKIPLWNQLERTEM